MELRQYLTIILRRWPIVVFCLLVTAGTTLVFVTRQAPVYEAEGTYVVRPRAVDSNHGLRAMDTQVRGVEINSTYATIARSERIRERAKERLGDASTSGIQVEAEVVTGTNILEIAVSGHDPEVVYDMATAVGAETVAYVSELQDVYELAALDAPVLPGKPAGPRLVLRVGTGVVFGLLVGALLALLTEAWLGNRRSDRFLRTEHGSRHRSAPGLLERSRPGGSFRERLSGAPPENRPFMVATLKVEPDGTGGRFAHGDRAFEQLQTLVTEHTPVMDGGRTPTYVGDGTFAMVLPDLHADEAEDLVRAWKAGVLVAAAQKGNGWHPLVSTQVLRYDGSERHADTAALLARLELP